MRTVIIAAFVFFALAGLTVGLTSQRPADANVVFETIDNFDNGDNNVLLQVSNADSFPVERSDIYPDSAGQNTGGIIGGERDLTLRVLSSTVSRALVNSYIAQEAGTGFTFWDVSTPGGTTALSFLQYDGVDGNGNNLQTNGLGGEDLTFAGAAGYVHVVVSNDVSTNYDFLFVSTSGAQCTYRLDLPGTDGEPEQTDYFITFSEFQGGRECFQNIGAIQITGNQDPNVDAQLFLFEIVGTNPSPTSTSTRTATPSPAPPTQTATSTSTATRSASPAPPSPSPTPSRSFIPPTPSATPTPTPTPTPTSTPSVDIFRWYEIDDDNGREPCDPVPPRRDYWIKDDNVVYYYFYGFHDDDLDFYSKLSGSAASAIVPAILGVASIIALML